MSLLSSIAICYSPTTILMIMEAANEKQQQQITSTDPAFPLAAVAALSIVCTALFLLAYYLIVTRCCSNWLRRISSPQARQEEDPFIALSSPTMWSRGLEDSDIREIPTIRFRREVDRERNNVYGSCMVCLNEFQERDMLRMLPKCSHTFHLDCIDIWLQENVNCPLCRTSISGAYASGRCPVDRITAPSSSPQGSSQLYPDSLLGGDEDFVVIELWGEDGNGFLPRKQPEIGVQGGVKSRSPMRVRFMGDECLNVREEEGEFSIQPIRRSFSLDSAGDRRLLLSVQSMAQQKQRTAGEGCSSSGNRVIKSLFPLGQGRGSRNAVLPVDFDL